VAGSLFMTPGNWQQLRKNLLHFKTSLPLNDNKTLKTAKFQEHGRDCFGKNRYNPLGDTQTTKSTTETR